VKKYGMEEAMLMSLFESSHPKRFEEIVSKYELDCDIRLCDTVDAYYDHDGLQRATDAVKAISEHVPELVYGIYSGEEAQERFRVASSCVGAITYPAGQIWPYKFVTQIVEFLLEHGLNLQTETPVTRVVAEGNKWRVETSRGSILVTHVVHATNGYTAYLLPSFSRIIKPTRGHMTAQIPPKSLAEPPLDHTYSFLYEDGKFDYFIQQPASYGSKLMLGGGYYEDPGPTTADDTNNCEITQAYLRDQLPKVFQWEGEQDRDSRISVRWSGIMGFSEDGFPWVGSLCELYDGGKGQFICAGYTGEGIPLRQAFGNERDAERVALCGDSCDDGAREGTSRVLSEKLSIDGRENEICTPGCGKITTRGTRQTSEVVDGMAY
jgi:glycine/D-amino acid oxidase-like deaminating enzyme